MARKTDTPAESNPSHGLVAGGRGGPEEELLQAGQEEVFSRTEVESGRIEHQAEAGGEAVDGAAGRPSSPRPQT